MIGSLRGTPLERGIDWVLLEVHGIGFRVRATPSTISDTQGKEQVFLYTYDLVREDARELFGFARSAELQLFEKLLSISGVGPKAAMTILSIGSVDRIQSAIMSGDLAMLTSVPGVGTKTAQKIILELKGQLVSKDDIVTPDQEVIQALIGLGYSSAQAKDVCQHLPADLADPSERVRAALKLLAK